jgi:hypothetical protein
MCTVEKRVEEKKEIALSARAYTTTLLVIVDRVRGDGRAPPPSPGWAEFTIMMECTRESGHC